MGGFETPADSGTLTNFVEMGQARDKILSLKLDQVCLPVAFIVTFSNAGHSRSLELPPAPGFPLLSTPKAT